MEQHGELNRQLAEAELELKQRKVDLIRAEAEIQVFQVMEPGSPKIAEIKHQIQQTHHCIEQLHVKKKTKKH